MKLYQQGDVLLKGIEEMPSKKELEPVLNNVLAEGELTGHAHKVDLTKVQADKIRLLKDKQGNLYVQAKETFDVVHEEHKTITVPKGNYKVDIVKEFDHFAEEARRVQD